MTRWLVDGMNVVGSRPDGWWADRPGAVRRLIASLDAFARTTGDEVTVVFDGRSGPSGTDVEVRFSPHADDLIAQLAAPGITVVTSDAGLRARLPTSTNVVGAGTFRHRIEE